MFERLLRSGVLVSSVVDVGAFRAQWTQLLRATYPHARSLLIEPQPAHAPILGTFADESEAATLFVPALVGAAAAPRVTFHVLDDGGGGTGSSVLRELSNVPGHEEYLPMRTLDEILHETAFGVPDLLKIDVQGYELEVLRGLGALIHSIDFILLEVAVMPYNESAPLVLDVLTWMHERGFAPHDVAGETRLPDGTLAQIDILFIRSDHPLRAARVVEY